MYQSLMLIKPTVYPRRSLWSLGIRLGLIAAVATGGYALARVPPGTIFELAIPYPDKLSSGSTHEITYNQNGGDVFWVTGQNYDTLVKVGLNGALRFYPGES